MVSVTRRAVLQCLAESSAAHGGETTTVEALAAALNTDELTVRAHLRRLVDCDVARVSPGGEVRVTTTGEELLDLGLGGLSVIDSEPDDADG
ncbi:ArsR family transcriptional regulator [Halobellus sp. Atlit-31R]|nr:ArsR family transcriptional regulator [Halobellus sp. Atlit-31R]